MRSYPSLPSSFISALVTALALPVVILSFAGCGGSSGVTFTPEQDSDLGETTGDANDAASEVAPDTATDTGSEVVATDAPADAPESDAAAKACTGTAGGCASTEYCDATDCGAGTCKPRPASSSDYSPVCGCDGVSYWNAAYAKSTGASVKSGVGECGATVATTCGSSKKCPHTTDKCNEAHATFAECSGTPSGTCWSFPPEAACPVIGGSKNFRACSGGLTGTCITECDAIKASKAYYGAGACI